MTAMAPRFWAGPRDAWPARLLAPLGALYAWGTRRRLAQPARDPGLPVLCCGNASAGGSGKTPAALYLLAVLQARGTAVCAVTRGHSGRLRGPHWVDVDRDGAAAVGDEPLLLARQAPTVVARDRLAGARAAAAAGFAAAVLDDGLQNPQPARVFNLLVVDGASGFGNGRPIPAGPLREPASRAAARCQGALVIGPDRSGAAAELPARLPVYRAAVHAASAVPAGPLVAFAGLGRPDKLFALLRAEGGDVAEAHAFPDHYRYRPADLQRLAARAAAAGAQLVTTAKDAVRLPPGWASRVQAIDTVLALDSAEHRRLADAVTAAVAAYTGGAATPEAP